MADRPTVVVSKSEPDDYVAKLCAFGLNAVSGEAGSDYVFYPQSQQWGIERKTVSNLLQSLGDRQLVEQTHRGAEQFDRYIILIEGSYSRSSNGKLSYYSPSDPRAGRDGLVESGWDYSSVNGMLFSLTMIAPHVMVHHWPVLYDAPSCIANIVHATSNPDTGKFIRERQRPELRKLGPKAALGGKLYTDAVWALCALPGCGAETAEALLEECGTLAAVINTIASFNGLEDIKVNGKKLGTKRASKLYAAVTERFS